ncbi:MAG: TlyA family RNA methyltransferase [Campylobacterota bacterium]|nr:TlyA family RNA methyltransferase [Campylobacterota bacterium]
MRLDLYVTQHFTIQSRNKAAELIKNKKVQINNTIITKPSYKVESKDKIKLLEDDFYVSRSAYKLRYFLEDIDLNLSSLEALDIGSSTGGFTQILLNNDVKSVTCVDVGSNQLHPLIKNYPNIIMHENTDIRTFKPNQTFDVVTCDVSFISIHHILNDIDRLSSDSIIILYKPQFEVGKECKRDRNGVVQDQKMIQEVRALFIQATQTLNWEMQHHALSKLEGKEGNLEELFYFSKS